MIISYCYAVEYMFPYRLYVWQKRMACLSFRYGYDNCVATGSGCMFFVRGFGCALFYAIYAIHVDMYRKFSWNMEV